MNIELTGYGDRWTCRSQFERHEFVRAMETNQRDQRGAKLASLEVPADAPISTPVVKKHSGAGSRRGGDHLERIISEMPAGADVRLQEIAPSGALIARKWRNGVVKFFWRTTFNKQLFREEIGIYSSTANRSWKVAAEDGSYCVHAAIAKATALALEHEQARGDGGLRGKREKEQAAQLEQARLDEAQRLSLDLERQAREKKSLQVLLEHYWKKLEAKKASSAAEVRNALKRHVTESKIASVQSIALMPAKDVTRDDIVAILAPIYGDEHGRQANKIRSYLHSAFEMAIDAAGNADTVEAVREFDLQWNPVSKTARNRQYNRSAKWPLSIEEMREYWRLIRNVQGIVTDRHIGATA